MSSDSRPTESIRWGLIAAAWSVYALYYLGRVNFSIAVPRLGEEAGLDATEIGALAAGFFWVYSLSAVPVGRIADRYGVRWLTGLGLVGSGLMNLLFIVFAENFSAALVIWSANGVFQAMGWTPLAGGLGRWVSGERAGRVIASFGSCFVAGTAFTFAVGGFIVERGGAQSAFLAATIVMVPIGMIWWIGVRDPVVASASTLPLGGLIRQVFWLLPPAGALGVAYVALIVWTPAYFVEVHSLTVGRAGLLSAALPAISILATIWVGSWFRSSEGAEAVLKGGIVLGITAVLLFLVGQAPGLLTAFPAIAAATALVGASSSLVMGLYPRIAAPGRVALASGIFAMVFNLGGGAGAPVVSRFVDRATWDQVFNFLALSVLAGGIWSYIWYLSARHPALFGRFR
ncbi:MAG: MFS transporter [bacterium]|nr:MFS transporter [bacterium]